MSLQSRAISIADAAAGAVGLLDRPLSADAMIAQAVRRAGCDDFGDFAFIEPLRRLLAACDADASLSLVGRIATRWDVIRFLTNLLRLRAEERAAPEIADEPIAAPIFITGLPRSGTTFLHRLLLQDPGNVGPTVWQTIYPYPVNKPGQPDRRIASVAGQLRAFERLAPEFRALHPLDADSPQECSEITAHVFRSLRFDSNYRVPSYRCWLDLDGHLEAYRFHRRFLQHLQHQERAANPDAKPRRWVLKCPEHIFALDAIRAVYPDARVVFAHRDPLKVLLSVAELTEVLRAPFTRRLDRAEIGHDESRRYELATQVMMNAARRDAFAAPISHVRHTDLIADPNGAVRRLYAGLGMTLSDETIAGVAQYTAQRPNGGYGAHDYHFEDHDLRPEVEAAKFAAYMTQFEIVAEERPRSAEAALAAD
jgi:hypothetical protein